MIPFNFYSYPSRTKECNECAGFTGAGDGAGEYEILSALNAPCFSMATAIVVVSDSVVLIHLCFIFFS